MRSRLQALRRMATLYGIVEEMHSAELRRMSAAVHEVRQAIGTQAEMVQAAERDDRKAIDVGDRMGSTIAEVQRQSAGLKQRRLDPIRVQREELSEAARAQYFASRMKTEQMTSLVESLRAQLTAEEEKVIQAASDDRFLARRRWNDARNSTRVDTRMKNS